jgi:glycosyltransferase involved in cell wall biosynthesis
MSGGARISSVLFLSPESPYPLQGGGQYRTASLIHYFARFANVDLILFSEEGKPALLPPGLVRRTEVIPLPKHGKGLVERYSRNARRAVRGVPPLVDRLSGLAPQIRSAISGNHYDLGVVEHFWLAQYHGEMAACCGQTVLDLHNVESVLHETCAAAGTGLVALGHTRFAAVTREMESALFPRYSSLLTTSKADETRVRKAVPSANVHVYPNAIPWQPVSALAADDSTVIFSGNFEYHPNIDAVRYMVSDIWPLIRRQRSDAILRLVGRGDGFIREFTHGVAGVEVTGPVEDAGREIARGTAVIAPLRMGSGTRIKILEAWAAGRPVIATRLAAEGLETLEGENILFADTPAEFAGAVLKTLEDSGMRARLGGAGRCTFERNYTWEAAWATLDPYLQVTRPETVNRYTE